MKDCGRVFLTFIQAHTRKHPDTMNNAMHAYGFRIPSGMCMMFASEYFRKQYVNLQFMVSHMQGVIVQ